MVIGDKIPWAPVLRLHAPILALVVGIAAAVAGAHRFLGFTLALAPLPFSAAASRSASSSRSATTPPTTATGRAAS